MNVAAHQEKEKNAKTSKRKTGEERRQADFKEAACYPSAVVQGLHGEKMVCVRGVPFLQSFYRSTAIFTQPKRVMGPHHHVEAAVDWCSLILLASHVHTIYIRQKFRTSLSKKIGVNTFFGGRKEGP